MDKGKNKGGMLAAGKKRLEQFRQKKGKGNSSKSSKQEVDLERGRAGNTDHVYTEHGSPAIDVELGPQSNTNVGQDALHESSQSTSERSDVCQDEANTNLMIEVRVDDAQQHVSLPPANADSYESTKVSEPGVYADPGTDAITYVPQENVELDAEKPQEDSHVNVNVNDDNSEENSVNCREDMVSQVHDLTERLCETSALESSSHIDDSSQKLVQGNIHPDQTDLLQSAKELQSQSSNSCGGEIQLSFQTQQEAEVEPSTDPERVTEPLNSNVNVCDVSSVNVLNMQEESLVGSTSNIAVPDMITNPVNIQDSDIENSGTRVPMNSEAISGINHNTLLESLDAAANDKSQEYECSTTVVSEIVKGDVVELAVKLDAEDNVQITANELQCQSRNSCGGEVPFSFQSHEEAEEEPTTDCETVAEPLNSDVNACDVSALDTIPVQDGEILVGPTNNVAVPNMITYSVNIQDTDIENGGTEKPTNSEVTSEINNDTVLKPLGVVGSEVIIDTENDVQITEASDRSSNISEYPNTPGLHVNTLENEQTDSTTSPDVVNHNETVNVYHESVAPQACMHTASMSEPNVHTLSLSSSEVKPDSLDLEEQTGSPMANAVHEERTSDDELNVINRDLALSREILNTSELNNVEGSMESTRNTESIRSGLGNDDAGVVVSLDLNVGGKSEDECTLKHTAEETSSSLMPGDSLSSGSNVLSQNEGNTESDICNVNIVSHENPLSEYEITLKHTAEETSCSLMPGDSIPMGPNALSQNEGGAGADIYNVNIVSHENPLFPLSEKSFGEQIPLEEKIVLEEKVIELQLLLSAKEAEIGDLISKMNSQSVQENNQLNAALTFLGCLLDRLSHLVSQDLNTNKEFPEKFDITDDMHQQEGKPSITFECLMQNGNHWIDQLQKNIDEKREMEITFKHYEGILSRKDNEMEDLVKKITDLQKDKEGYLDMEKKLQQLEDLLSQKEINELELSKKFSELSEQHEIVQKELEENKGMGARVKHLEELLLSKESQIELSSKNFLELSKDFDVIQKDFEEKRHMESRVKDLEELLSSKELEIERLSERCLGLQKDLEEKDFEANRLMENSSKQSDVERLSEKLEELSRNNEELQKDIEAKSQMESRVKNLEQLLHSKELDIEKLSLRLEEMSQMETRVEELSRNNEELQRDIEEKSQMESKVKDLEQLLLSKESDLEKLSLRLEEKSQMETRVKDLEQLLSSKESDLENLSERLEEMSQMEIKVKYLEQLLSSKESDIEKLSERLQEMSQVETKVKDLEQLLSSKESYIENLSERLEEKSQMEAKIKDLEQLLFSKESDLVMLSERLEEKSQVEAKIKDLEQILSSKEIYLTERLFELSRTNEDLQKITEEKREVENKVRDLEGLLTLKQTDIEGLSQRLVDLQGDIQAKSQVESQVRDLENLLSMKDTHISEVSQQINSAEKEKAELEANLSSMQTLYVEKDTMYSSISSHLDALLERVSAALGHDIPNNAENSVHGLESCIVALLNQNESLREGQQLLTKANTSETEIEHLKSVLATKENEICNLHEQVNIITTELSSTREGYERKLSQSEEKLHGVREKLSLAVTKGKGLLQQRDNLKQLLAEKASELEALTSSYNQELHLKVAALHDAENKVKLYAESVERVEALESELSYIRNSANTLRESFLQKDAVLQKIEELLDDANLPEELQIKDSFEKVEWLIETFNQKTLMFEGQSLPQAVTLKDSDELVVRHQDVQVQEIEDLNQKHDDLLRKYREMAEQTAMLEQSLLERNLVIQRWEEVLDSIEMPPVVRSKEPEDRIEWLGRALSDAHDYASQLQIETESLNMRNEDLSRALQKLQADNNAMSHELDSKNNEIKMMVISLEDVTAKNDTLSKNLSEQVNVSSIRERSQASELNDHNEDGNQHIMLSSQRTELDDLLNKVQTMLAEVLQKEVVHNIFSDNTGIFALENSVRLLIDNHKASSLEATDARGKLEEMQRLYHDLSYKTKEGDDLRLKTEELLSKNSSLEHEVESLQNHVNAVTEELSLARAELTKLQVEASQSEEKIASLREKLSMAVKKGKSVVQQRDSLKQSLEETTAELNEKIREQETKNLALVKAEQNCKHLVQTVGRLEADLSSSREHALNMERSLQESNRAFQRFAEAVENATVSGGPRSGDIIEKIQWLSQAVTESQRKASASEQETKKAKKTAELLGLDLEELQGRMDSVKDELAHAENSILTLTEQKKAAEAVKAEAGLRLEHAMANINSLVFELSEARESQANLERENSSLKDALSSQMEEIRLGQNKAEEHLKNLTDLYNKIHSLREFQANLFKFAVDNVLKMSQEAKNTKVLAFRLTEELTSFFGTNINQSLTEIPDNVGDIPSYWYPKNSLSKGNHLDWERGMSMGSLKLECADMEDDLKTFFGIFQNLVVSVSHNSTSVSELLLEMCNELKPGFEKMGTRMGDAVLEKIKNLFGEVQSMQIRACGKTSSPQIADVMQMPGNDMRAFSFAIIEHLCTSVKDLVSFQEQKRIESESHSQLLQGQLEKAREVINYLDQQQQLDKVQINDLQTCVEELQSDAGALRKTNQELHSLHEDLLRKGQGEKELVISLENSEAKVAELSAKVEELNKSKKELEVSLSKASSRLIATVDNFNKFKILSEKLIEEAESLHLLLEGRDAEISQLRNELNGLQSLVNQKTTDLSQIYQEIKHIVARNIDNSDIPRDSESEGRSIKELLKSLATVVHSGTEDLRIQLARKDALLQDMQMRHDELSTKMNLLQASLLENQRLMEERESSFVADRISSSTESDEMGSRLITTPAAIVTRGRKLPVSDHVAVDVVAEPSRSTADSEDVDDKGHAFKPLTSSRLVPRGTRFLVDRIDGFWVSGERLLMRRPDARIAVMLYWLSLHIWMAMLLL